MKLPLFSTTILAGCIIVALSGCVYRMDIPQGNRIDDTVIQQLKVGMSRNQVTFLMGSPAIIDLYHPDKWHYIYYLKTGEDGKIEKGRLTLVFTNDLLASIDGSARLN